MSHPIRIDNVKRLDIAENKKRAVMFVNTTPREDVEGSAKTPKGKGKIC